jgi:hypothetical protein
VVVTGAVGPEDLDPETMAGLVQLYEQYKADT